MSSTILLQKQFVAAGGRLQDGEPVTGISPGSKVEVLTNKGRYTAGSVVLCVGPWTNKLLTYVGNFRLPLKVQLRTAV